MSDRNGTTGEEWLTVAAIAERLNRPARSIRRWVEKMPPDAVRPGHPGQPSAVRVSVLIEIMEGRYGQKDGQQGTPTDSPGTPAVTTGQPPESEVTEALRSEVAFLRSVIEATTIEKAEMRRLMMADRQELQQLRQKAALLIAPPVEEPTPDTMTSLEQVAMATQNLAENSSSAVLNSSASEQEAEPATHSAPQEALQTTEQKESGKPARDAQEAPQTQRRAWWKFWERG